MSNFTALTFSSRQLLDTQLAEDVAAILIHHVDCNETASLVISGGSTPRHFFRVLSNIQLPWEKVVITLADERWVAPDDIDSNEKLVRENLLINEAARAQFLPFKNSSDDAQGGVAELETALSAIGRFSVVILGMGNDGHTASLFPGTKALVRGLDMNSGASCIAVEPVMAPHQRLSLTLPRLLDTNNLFIHITGSEKKAVLDHANVTAEPYQLPISAVLHQDQTPVTLYWSK